MVVVATDLPLLHSGGRNPPILVLPRDASRRPPPTSNRLPPTCPPPACRPTPASVHTGPLRIPRRPQPTHVPTLRGPYREAWRTRRFACRLLVPALLLCRRPATPRRRLRRTTNLASHPQTQTDPTLVRGLFRVIANEIHYPPRQPLIPARPLMASRRPFLQRSRDRRRRRLAYLLPSSFATVARHVQTSQAVALPTVTPTLSSPTIRRRLLCPLPRLLFLSHNLLPNVSCPSSLFYWLRPLPTALLLLSQHFPPRWRRGSRLLGPVISTRSPFAIQSNHHLAHLNSTLGRTSRVSLKHRPTRVCGPPANLRHVGPLLVGRRRPFATRLLAIRLILRSGAMIRRQTTRLKRTRGDCPVPASPRTGRMAANSTWNVFEQTLFVAHPRATSRPRPGLSTTGSMLLPRTDPICRRLRHPTPISYVLSFNVVLRSPCPALIRPPDR